MPNQKDPMNALEEISNKRNRSREIVECIKEILKNLNDFPELNKLRVLLEKEKEYYFKRFNYKVDEYEKAKEALDKETIVRPLEMHEFQLNKPCVSRERGPDPRRRSAFPASSPLSQSSTSTPLTGADKYQEWRKTAAFPKWNDICCWLHRLDRKSSKIRYETKPQINVNKFETPLCQSVMRFLPLADLLNLDNVHSNKDSRELLFDGFRSDVFDKKIFGLEETIHWLHAKKIDWNPKELGQGAIAYNMADSFCGATHQIGGAFHRFVSPSWADEVGAWYLKKVLKFMELDVNRRRSNLFDFGYDHDLHETLINKCARRGKYKMLDELLQFTNKIEEGLLDTVNRERFSGDHNEVIYLDSQLFEHLDNDQREALGLGEMFNVKGMSPLHFAALGGQTSVVSLLIEKYPIFGYLGGNINISNQEEHWNWSPLHLACLKGHVDTVKILLKAGAKVDAVTNPNPGDDQDWNGLHGGLTPLHCAILGADPSNQSFVKGLKLLKASTANEYKNSLMEESRLTSWKCIDIAKMLINPKEHRYFKEDIENEKSIKHKNDRKLTNTLQNSSLTCADKDGCTALHLACMNSNSEYAKALVYSILNLCDPKTGDVPNLDIKNVAGDSCMHIAIEKNYIDIVKLLHPIPQPSSMEHRQKALRTKPSDLCCRDNSGNTPLILAVTHSVTHSHIEIIKYLLDRGARLDQKNQDGENPKDIAEREKEWQILEILNTHRKTPGEY